MSDVERLAVEERHASQLVQAHMMSNVYGKTQEKLDDMAVRYAQARTHWAAAKMRLDAAIESEAKRLAEAKD